MPEYSMFPWYLLIQTLMQAIQTQCMPIHPIDFILLLIFLAFMNITENYDFAHFLL